MELLHGELTDKIINAFYKVYNVLGYGFLERVYENAMFVELKRQGLAVTKQQHIQVFYEDQPVGEYFADLLVEDLVVIELKASGTILEEHEQQLLNYLKATDKEIGLLFNFGKKPQFKRKYFKT